MNKISHIHARFLNQYNLKYQTVLSARFDKQGEGNQILDEIELYINFNNNGNLTESDIDTNDITS